MAFGPHHRTRQQGPFSARQHLVQRSFPSRACCGRIWAFLVPAVVTLDNCNDGRVRELKGETDEEFARGELLI